MTRTSEVDASNDVTIVDTGVRAYPSLPPFDPPERYPELPAGIERIDAGNAVYSGVREVLRSLGFDVYRYGTADWNPLGVLIRPGDRVVVKPNIVRDFHGANLGLDALVTHGSIVRAILDYVVIALKGEGEIVVGDSPLQYSYFEAAVDRAGVGAAVEAVGRYAGVALKLLDFRIERSEKRGGIIVDRIRNGGDPEGYRVVDLGEASRFAGIPIERSERFRVTQYDPSTMKRAHNAATHAYLVPASVLKSDVFINLPKLKTHRKAGITAAMKNLVGINGSKDWLPHHTSGARADGGDEYLRRSARKRLVSYIRDRIEGRRGVAPRRALHFLERAVKATRRVAPFPDPYWEGSWHGNDTLWRMVHDLHRVLFYADAEGRLHDRPRRRYLALVDAVVAGEGEGPMRPAPRPIGLLIGGTNPAAVDLVCCRLIGFDERKIPLLSHAIGNGVHPGVASLESIRVISPDGRWDNLFALARDRTLRFVPPAGWAGAIEMDGMEALAR